MGAVETVIRFIQVKSKKPNQTDHESHNDPRIRLINLAATGKFPEEAEQLKSLQKQEQQRQHNKNNRKHTRTNKKKNKEQQKKQNRTEKQMKRPLVLSSYVTM